MARIAYVNGRYVHHADAAVHIEDRGYQFADGIYEYMAFYDRHLLDESAHLERLQRSCEAMGMALPVTLSALRIIFRELLARNERTHGGLYLQTTRGVARRDHAFPKTPVQSSLVVTVGVAKMPKPEEVSNGVAVMTYPDLRWGRRDIKSVSLLANVLAKQEATAHKMREAWLVEVDGNISEGAVSNAYIINHKGELVTHPADEHILAGITREVVLKLAKKAGIKVVEKPFTLADVKEAAEAFMTSTSINVLPVVKVDDMTIGNGKPGDVTLKLLKLYTDHIHKQTGWRA